MAHGGRRSGSGRKVGQVTTKSRAIADRAIAEGLTPLEYLLSVMRDEGNETFARVDAAKAAARYMHAPLAAIEPPRPVDEYVPLAERLKEYARDDAIEASEGKVVEFGRPDR